MSEAETTSPSLPEFLFVVCQNGAEAAARAEILANHPELKLAFSQPGFITFKVDADQRPPENFTLRSTLARTYGWSLGKCISDDVDQMVKAICDCPQFATAKHLHVWQRDPAIPGKQGFEPGVSPLAAAVAEQIAKQAKNSDTGSAKMVNRVAQPDDRVFDVVMVEPNQWWFGYHLASHTAGRWPGGAPIIDTSVEVYSRAYFKLKEALLWSGIKIQKGDVCAELGSAPGGACQLLLEQGAIVLAVDPAEMEPELLKDENITHIRRRASEVRKKDLSQVRWLISDINATPTYTLDAIEELVNHDRISVTGVIMTMKLTDWKMVNDIPDLMKRAKSLGFKLVKSRQLAFDRREFCMIAVKDRFALRSSQRTKTVKKRPVKKTLPKTQAPKSDSNMDSNT